MLPPGGTTSLERVSPAPAGPIPTVILSYSGSGDVTAPVAQTADAASVVDQGCDEVNGVGRSRPVSPPGQDVDGTPGGQLDDSGGGLHADHDEELVAS